MQFLVTYDIPQEYNNIRTRVARILKSWGLERIQYSVFMGDLTRNEAETVALYIKDTLKEIPADIRMIPICKNCLREIIIVSENLLSDSSEEELTEVTFF